MLPPVARAAAWIAAPVGSALSVERLPAAAQWIIAFLAVDLAAYGAHRLAHANRFLWRFHRIHHSDALPGALTAFRGHVVEIAWRLLARAVPLQLLRVDPWSMPIGLFVIPLCVEVLAHADINWSFGALLVGPAYHRVHHSADARQSRHNFAMLLPIWDVLFGTRTEAARPNAFGLAPSEALQDTLWGHLAALQENAPPERGVSLLAK